MIWAKTISVGVDTIPHFDVALSPWSLRLAITSLHRERERESGGEREGERERESERMTDSLPFDMQLLVEFTVVRVWSMVFGITTAAEFILEPQRSEPQLRKTFKMRRM